MWTEEYDTTFKHSQFIDHSQIKAFIHETRQKAIKEVIDAIPDMCSPWGDTYAKTDLIKEALRKRFL